MARRPDLEVFAREHGLKIGTIADLIRHRLEVEPSVERLVERPITTAHGDFKLVVYEDQMQRHVHLALIKGDLTGEKPPLVRVHLLDTLRDIVGAQLQFGGWSLDQALECVAADVRASWCCCGAAKLRAICSMRWRLSRRLASACRVRSPPPSEAACCAHTVSVRVS